MADDIIAQDELDAIERGWDSGAATAGNPVARYKPPAPGTAEAYSLFYAAACYGATGRPVPALEEIWTRRAAGHRRQR